MFKSLISISLCVCLIQNNGKLDKLPDFGKLTYADTGLYVLEMSVAGIKKSHQFELHVQGMVM